MKKLNTELDSHESQENTTAGDTGSTLSYEAAMQELEEIVDTLEDGQVPLGDSLKMVQRGRELSELCAQMLSEAELALSQLAATPEGELVEEPLEFETEA